jgi:hypothetical protein
MTVTNLFGAQLESMVKKVRRLAGSNGMDKEAYDAVRKQVSAEYMKNGRLDVVSATLGELNDSKAEQMLNEIITHCSESFYFEDRVLKTVVVPVAVRMRTRKDGDVTLIEGREDDLKTIAASIERRVGSRKVIFDNRMYSSNDLFYANPKKMCEFLLKLEAGEKQPEGGPKTVKVTSKSDSEWEMMYFLGVEVLDIGEKDRLNSEDAQRAMFAFRCHAEWAIAENNQVLFDTNVQADAKCYGFYYVNHGVKVGEEHVRSYRLASLLANMEFGVGGVRFKYAYDNLNFQVKLMVQSNLMTLEYKWKMLIGETTEPFKKALVESIDRVLPSDDVLEITELDMFDYEKVAESAGLTWGKR